MGARDACMLLQGCGSVNITESREIIAYWFQFVWFLAKLEHERWSVLFTQSACS